MTIVGDIALIGGFCSYSIVLSRCLDSIVFYACKMIGFCISGRMYQHVSFACSEKDCRHASSNFFMRKLEQNVRNCDSATAMISNTGTKEPPTSSIIAREVCMK